MGREDWNQNTNGFEAGITAFNPDMLLGQSFTTSGGYDIYEVKVKLQRGNTPGTLTCNLYAVDGGGLPTGGILSTGTTNGDTLPTGSFELRTISMSNYTLASTTQYIWVIDQASSTPGDVWNTQGHDGNPYAGGAMTHDNLGWAQYTNFDLYFQIWSEDAAPTKAENPSPANGATDEDFSGLQLSWDDGGGADTFEIFIGETGSLTAFLPAQAGTTFTVTMAELEAVFGTDPIEQKIYWRIDSTNAAGTTTGDEWNFDPRPVKASSPSPTDTVTGIGLGLTTTWTGSDIADTFDSYADVGAGLVIQSAGLESATWTPSPTIFGYAYTYTWRIDSTNAFGTTTGDEWTFTTLRFDPPVQTYFNPEKGPGGKWYYYLLIQFDGSYGDHPWDGGVEDTDWTYRPLGYEPNFIATVRKLVSVANSKIWFEDV